MQFPSISPPPTPPTHTHRPTAYRTHTLLKPRPHTHTHTHTHTYLQELSDVLDLGDGVVTSFELLEMAKEGLDKEVTEDVLCLWANYSGRRMFDNNSEVCVRVSVSIPPS
jgi:hypothetical protein